MSFACTGGICNWREKNIGWWNVRVAGKKNFNFHPCYKHTEHPELISDLLSVCVLGIVGRVLGIVKETF